MRTILAFVARHIHNVQVQVALATLHGLISIFGIGGTIAILMKVRKHASKAVVPRVRQGNRSVSGTTEVSNVSTESTRDLRTGSPRTSIGETESQAQGNQEERI